MSNFLSITDMNKEGMEHLFALTHDMKKHKADYCDRLAGKTLVMFFEKPSLRTKLSFDIGVTQLGGHAVYFGASEVGLGARESIADVACVASSMGDVLMARVYLHATIYELAQHASVPVINGLSDWEHPCQAMSDLFTILEIKKKLTGLTLAFVGDGENNIAHSLVLGGALWGMNVRVASPKGYEIKPEVSSMAQSICRWSHGSITETNDPIEAVRGADVVYTDTWVSMGDEADKSARLRLFRPYQVNAWLMSLAKKDAIFMHDLPAYRGNEVTADVIDGPQSVVYPQAENRLHVQKALMMSLVGRS